MNKKLKRYIKRALSRNIGKERITEVLLKSGWEKDVVEETFKDIENPPRGFFSLRRVEKKMDKLEEKVTQVKPVIVEEEEKKLGLSEKVDDLTEKMDLIIEKSRLKKGKPFKLPFKVRSQLNTLAQKDKVLILLLKSNRDIEPITAKITNGFIQIGEKFYNCSTAFIYLWLHKFPCIVLQEWNLEPIGTKDYFDAMKAGKKSDAQTIIIRALENKENLGKTKISGKMGIIIFIVGAILVYVLFGKG